MSQSKSAAKSKPAKPKAKAKAKGAAKRAAVETVRIIPAPQAETPSSLQLSASEKELSADAKALADKIEKALRGGELNAALDPAAVQALLAAASRVYSRHIERGELYDAFSQKNPVTPTDVMVTASGLLKAANLAVFELGMWQSWTGR